MLSFNEYTVIRESGPLSPQIQGVKNSYNPSNVHQQCGNCGQEPDIHSIQSKRCSVCNNVLDNRPGGLQSVESQPGSSVNKKLITPNMQPKVAAPGYGIRRGA